MRDLVLGLLVGMEECSGGECLAGLDACPVLFGGQGMGNCVLNVK